MKSFEMIREEAEAAAEEEYEIYKDNPNHSYKIAKIDYITDDDEIIDQSLRDTGK
ncbi:MAG: hypothetical protein LKM34_08830 [Prevotella sp.]|jgi:hypothetical protein|nr:hypothetical protein [Prevotella sp.]